MLRPRFKDPIKAARAKGCSMGRHGISRLIGPAYRTTTEWLAFYAGWRRGNAEYQRLVIEARTWATPSNMVEKQENSPLSVRKCRRAA